MRAYVVKKGCRCCGGRGVVDRVLARSGDCAVVGTKPCPARCRKLARELLVTEVFALEDEDRDEALAELGLISRGQRDGSLNVRLASVVDVIPLAERGQRDGSLNVRLASVVDVIPLAEAG